MRLTSRERAVLQALRFEPAISGRLATLIYGETYDSVHARLRRLEDRALVRRSGTCDGVTLWELTHTGREALEVA